jgi:hypothetical protein
LNPRYVAQCHFGHPEYTPPLNLSTAENTAAAFLCGAGADHYFVTAGWRNKFKDKHGAGDNGNFSEHWLPSIMGRPLGEPMADAVYDASTGMWSRSFATGTTVTFDALRNVGRIRWSDEHPPAPAPAPAPAGSGPQMPRFSWSTLPVFYHSANATGLFNSTSLEAISKYALVTLEKYQGPFTDAVRFHHVFITFYRCFLTFSSRFSLAGLPRWTALRGR